MHLVLKSTVHLKGMCHFSCHMYVVVANLLVAITNFNRDFKSLPEVSWEVRMYTIISGVAFGRFALISLRFWFFQNWWIIYTCIIWWAEYCAQTTQYMFTLEKFNLAVLSYITHPPICQINFSTNISHHTTCGSIRDDENFKENIITSYGML